MTATVEDEINALAKALSDSEYTKNEVVLIVKEYIGTIARNNISDDQRYNVAVTTADFTKRVRNHDWKFAHGFYGNWAKSVLEQKDQDVGC